MKRPESGVGPVLHVAVQAPRKIKFVQPGKLKDREPIVYTVCDNGIGSSPRFEPVGPFCSVAFLTEHLHWRHRSP